MSQNLPAESDHLSECGQEPFDAQDEVQSSNGDRSETNFDPLTFFLLTMRLVQIAVWFVIRVVARILTGYW